MGYKAAPKVEPEFVSEVGYVITRPYSSMFGQFYVGAEANFTNNIIQAMRYKTEKEAEQVIVDNKMENVTIMKLYY